MSEPKKKMPAAAYFCEVTGKRIVAPGVCKEVDPIKGQDTYVEPVEAPQKGSK